MIYAFVALLLVELVSFGIFSSQIGFYHDDWSFLELASQGGDFWGIVKAFNDTQHFPTRPVEIIQFPLFLVLGKFNPLIYQILQLSLETAQGFLFYLLLNRMTGSRQLALAAAALALMCPNRSATHFWFSNSPQAVSLVLVLASLLAQLNWLESRKRLWLVLAQAAYLLSVLSYESTAFFPLMLAGGLFFRARSSILRLWPYAVSLVIVVLWQKIGVSFFLGISNPKSIGMSAEHFLKAFGAGFECVSNRIFHICWKSAPEALRQFGFKHAFLGSAFTVFLAAKLSKDAQPLSSHSFRTALGIAAAGFVGAYAPYALSSDYMPQIYGVMSRTNAGGAFVAGLFFATGIFALRRPLARRALFTLVIGAFTWTNWASAAQWAGAWSLQKDILAQAGPLAAKLPAQATVLLTGAPSFVGHAIAFDASWDFAPALRLTTKRQDLSGNVVSSRMSFEKDGIYDKADGRRKLYSYGNLYLFDYAKGTMTLLKP